MMKLSYRRRDFRLFFHNQPMARLVCPLHFSPLFDLVRRAEVGDILFLWYTPRTQRLAHPPADFFNKKNHKKKPPPFPPQSPPPPGSAGLMSLFLNKRVSFCLPPTFFELRGSHFLCFPTSFPRWDFQLIAAPSRTAPFSLQTPPKHFHKFPVFLAFSIPLLTAYKKTSPQPPIPPLQPKEGVPIFSPEEPHRNCCCGTGDSIKFWNSVSHLFFHTFTFCHIRVSTFPHHRIFPNLAFPFSPCE